VFWKAEMIVLRELVIFKCFGVLREKIDRKEKEV
jgi:hypothetical protein